MLCFTGKPAHFTCQQGCNIWQWQLLNPREPECDNNCRDNFLLEDSTRYFLAERSRRTPQNDCHRNSPVDVLPFHANLSTKASNGILSPIQHLMFLLKTQSAIHTEISGNLSRLLSSDRYIVSESQRWHQIPSLIRQPISTPTAYGITTLSVASTPPIGNPYPA